MKPLVSYTESALICHIRVDSCYKFKFRIFYDKLSGISMKSKVKAKRKPETYVIAIHFKQRTSI